MSQTLRLVLDRTRKHASVHGEVENGLAYKQDGLPFDAQGNLIEALVNTPDLRAIVERKLKRVKKQVAPATPAEAGAQQEDDDDPADKNKAGDDDVNFDAWARGMVRYEWTLLQRVARKRFSRSFSSKENIIEFLIEDAKLIHLDDVHPSLRPKAAA